MTLALGATWTARPGHEDEIIRILAELTPATRAEKGNLLYVPTRSADDPSVFYLFEVYEDADAYDAHTLSEHFTRLVKDDAIPHHLASRERSYYEPLGDPA
ncbi:putative quinol monooxygenase [Actinomadura rayongensis]|uniref:Antibiotic biosynthesis monooxygenase n=1 Tax=Actinomadura rayongensis TaxID=1429076 RepID=A0A6I4WD38_9ACTN|nr:putative quinol monooxygenase [Actinomadura rayongensis]MXQ67551.1 antibiotic biosynthesis monooxygenase [Actinomadura rayongensis]